MIVLYYFVVVDANYPFLSPYYAFLTVTDCFSRLYGEIINAIENGTFKV